MHAYFVDGDGRLSLCLERMKGNLTELGGNVEPVAATLAIAEALRFLHGRGMIHRDVKPENVLISPDGQRVVLADFGLVRAMYATTLLSLPAAAVPSAELSAQLPPPPRVIRRNNSLTLGEPDAAHRSLLPRRLTPSAMPLPAKPTLRRQLTPQCGSLVTMAPEVWSTASGGGAYGYPADMYSLGRVISYLKAMHWRWRGVTVLDETEHACLASEPGQRPSAAAVCDALNAAMHAEASSSEQRGGRPWRFSCRVPAALMLLPRRLVQTVQYGLVGRAVILRPSFFLSSNGAGIDD
jgi:serine/threonine protein kinase